MNQSDLPQPHESQGPDYRVHGCMPPTLTIAEQFLPPFHRPGSTATGFQQNQMASTYPLVSFCDHVSTTEIRDELRALNSSITDLVNSIVENKLNGRAINLREGVSAGELTTLIQVALQQCGGRKKHERELRERFYEAILHDLIIDFIYECVEGDNMGGISTAYEKFRADIEKVRKTEAFVDAQNWIRIAAKLVETPSPETWRRLASDLVRNIDVQLFSFTGRSRNGWRKYVTESEEAHRFPRLIESAYALAMKIQSGVLSQRLKLTLGQKDTCADFGVVHMGQEFDAGSNLKHFAELETGDYLILGNRSLGLSGISDDGTEVPHLKPAATVARVVL